jgi:hypothetical protein
MPSGLAGSKLQRSIVTSGLCAIAANPPPKRALIHQSTIHNISTVFQLHTSWRTAELSHDCVCPHLFSSHAPLWCSAYLQPLLFCSWKGCIVTALHCLVPTLLQVSQTRLEQAAATHLPLMLPGFRTWRAPSPSMAEPRDRLALVRPDPACLKRTAQQMPHLHTAWWVTCTVFLV